MLPRERFLASTCVVVAGLRGVLGFNVRGAWVPTEHDGSRAVATEG